MTGNVTAIVVHHEQPARCVETIDRLRAQGAGMRVIVVDNGSSPGALEHIRERSPGVELIATGTNLGFGGGANVGLRAFLAETETHPIASEWALVVPHDVRPQPECLDRLLAAASAQPHAGLASAEYGQDEVPVIDPYFGGMTVAAPRGEGWQPAGFAHGTFLLLRRGCLDDIGLFDESYFAYCEEADLAIRARRAGWEVGMVWGAVVSNPHQGSPPPLVDYLMLRNTVVLVRRHFGRYKATVRFVMATITTCWLAVRRSRRTPWYSGRARLLALRDVVLGRLGAPPESLVAMSRS